MTPLQSAELDPTNADAGVLTRKMPENSMGFGNPIGHIRKGNATIYASLATGQQTLFDANSVISELFHLAGRNNYYSDKELATALGKSPYARNADEFVSPGLNPFNRLYKGRPDWTEDNQYAYSYYFHAVQENICHVLSGTHEVR